MRSAILIVFIFYRLQCFGEAQNTGNIRIISGFYCPDKTDWGWRVAFARGISGQAEETQKGTATDHFQYVQMDLDDFEIYEATQRLFYAINQRCTSDGSEEPLIFSMFISFRIRTRDSKLCPDCASVRKRVDCSQLADQIPAKELEDACTKGFDSAYSMHMSTTADPTTSTQKSNTKTVIIIGAAVGAVLLIAAFVVCFFCKRKNNSAPEPSGTTSGINKKTKSTTKSRTTKKTTTTGTFQKTDNTGSNVTGAKRY